LAFDYDSFLDDWSAKGISAVPIELSNVVVLIDGVVKVGHAPTGSPPVPVIPVPPSGTGSGAATIVLTRQNAWSTGFVFEYTLTNTGSPLVDWKIKFTLPAGVAITNYWNVQLVSGTTYSAMTYNNRIEMGASVTFGIQGTCTSVPTIAVSLA
jgi:cellulase/cellobiase CelA1